MSSEWPFVNTRQRNQAFSPPVTECDCGHGKLFSFLQVEQKVVMEVMGSDRLHRFLERSQDVNQRFR